jgi:hypothetical protein
MKSILAISLALFVLALVSPVFLSGTGQQSPPPSTAPTEGAALADTVLVRMARNPALAGSKIRVSTRNGTVTLTGTVPSDAARLRAEQIAMKTPAVTAVRNQLTVNQAIAARAQNVSGADLSRQVAQTLAQQFPKAQAREDMVNGWQVQGPNYLFDVEADEGIVTLEGSVPTANAIVRAVTAARDVPGVRAVNTELWYYAALD